MNSKDQPAQASGDRSYVLRKRGFFYRVNNMGYTSEIQDAHRYTKEEAEAQKNGRPEVTIHLVSDYALAHASADSEEAVREALRLIDLREDDLKRANVVTRGLLNGDERCDRNDRERSWLNQLRAALRHSQPSVRPQVSIVPMPLSDGRTDYFVSIKCGDREVTPHVFHEEYKAAYHVALYNWLLNGSGEEPDVVAFGPDDWPAQVRATPDHAAVVEALTTIDGMLEQPGRIYECSISVRDWLRKAINALTTPSSRAEDNEAIAAENADNVRLLDFIADKIGLPHNEELTRENFSAWLRSSSRAEPVAYLALVEAVEKVDVELDLMKPAIELGDPAKELLVRLRDARRFVKEAKAALSASPLSSRAEVVEECARIEPTRSETHHLQADGYAFGWSQAVKAYRAAIRALAQQAAQES